MFKTQATSSGSVIDAASHVFPEQIGLTVKGFGSMKDIMDLDAIDIDLTKPIYEQVFNDNGRLRVPDKEKSAKAA